VRRVGGGRVDVRAEQRAGGRAVERPEDDRRGDALALGTCDRGLQARGHAARARGPGDRDRRPRRTVEQRDEQVDRRRVGPLDVVEYEDERAAARELLDQCADGAVRAVALAGAEGRRRPRAGALRVGRGREDRGEVGPRVVDPRRRGGAERAQRRVERVDPQAVGQGVLLLGGAAVEDGRAAPARGGGELREEVGLSDSGLAAECDDAGRAGGGRVDRARGDCKLRVAADDPTGHPGVRPASA
jgi:hypothetical protein